MGEVNRGMWYYVGIAVTVGFVSYFAYKIWTWYGR